MAFYNVTITILNKTFQKHRNLHLCLGKKLEVLFKIFPSYVVIV